MRKNKQSEVTTGTPSPERLGSLMRCCETCKFYVTNHKNQCLATGDPNAVDVWKLQQGHFGLCSDWIANT